MISDSLKPGTGSPRWSPESAGAHATRTYAPTIGRRRTTMPNAIAASAATPVMGPSAAPTPTTRRAATAYAITDALVGSTGAAEPGEARSSLPRGRGQLGHAASTPRGARSPGVEIAARKRSSCSDQRCDCSSRASVVSRSSSSRRSSASRNPSGDRGAFVVDLDRVGEQLTECGRVRQGERSEGVHRVVGRAWHGVAKPRRQDHRD